MKFFRSARVPGAARAPRSALALAALAAALGGCGTPAKVTQAQAPGVQTFPLIDTAGLTPLDVVVEPATYEGKSAVKVELTPEEQAAFLDGTAMGNNFTMVMLPVDFKDGTIELDLAGEVNGKGSPDVRGFVGIAFRASEESKTYEAIYLRMTNGRLADPPPPAPRDERAIQYISYPQWPFSRLRTEHPGVYEKGADIAPKTWIHYRIEVSGRTARAFVDGGTEPALAVEDLRLGEDARGAIGLWVDDGTAGYFSNLKVTAAE